MGLGVSVRTCVAGGVMVVCGSIGAPTATAATTQSLSFSDISGLSAEVLFTLIDPLTFEIHLSNTSTGAPAGFSNSDQILTGVSWDFGSPGFNGDAQITGGTVKIGPTSQSLDFDQVTTQLGPGDDVSGEWGFGNMDGTGALTNFISALTAVATPFGGTNLDGPVSIDGPQGGLVADPAVLPLGGLGAVSFEVVATLTLSEPLTNLDFLNANLVRFEFGSDALFFTVPAPGASMILCVAGLAAARRRRR